MKPGPQKEEKYNNKFELGASVNVVLAYLVATPHSKIPSAGRDRGADCPF